MGFAPFLNTCNRAELCQRVSMGSFRHRQVRIRRVSISDLQLSDIERAALLHNLGRVALSDRFRFARTARCPQARALRSYPLHGQAMLKNVPFLATASETMLQLSASLELPAP